MNILLIAPPFHGYHKSIIKELRIMGGSVSFISDHPFLYLLASNIPFLFKHLATYLYLFLIYISVQSRRHRYVLIIKGVNIQRVHIEFLKRLQPDIKILMYQWDSLKNHDFKYLINLCSRSYTFDPVDAEDLGINYLPLFYTENYAPSQYIFNQTYAYDVVFIGGLTAHRCNILHQIIRNFSSNNITFFYYLYLPAHIYVLKRLFGSLNFSRGLKVHTVPLSHQMIKQIYGQARSILDIHSSSQSGCTMRTIEALASGRLLLTSNKWAQTLCDNSSHQVITFDSSNPSLNEHCSTIRSYNPIAARCIQDLSLRSWLLCMFDNFEFDI
jgi:hypothetical protein